MFAKKTVTNNEASPDSISVMKLNNRIISNFDKTEKFQKIYADLSHVLFNCFFCVKVFFSILAYFLQIVETFKDAVLCYVCQDVCGLEVFLLPFN